MLAAPQYLTARIKSTAVSYRIVTQTATSSSAVAERPRNTSCLSAVGFDSTSPRAQSFIISYFGFKYITAYN